MIYLPYDKNGGDVEIRTLGTASRSVDFESTAFDHSATSPHKIGDVNMELIDGLL